MWTEPLFRNRASAGRKLAEPVVHAVSDPHALVLALPRGGVPVGFEVARALRSELDVFLVRKLGMPGQEELALGAIASGGMRVLNQALLRECRIPTGLIDQISAREESELKRQEQVYRQNRPASPVIGRTVVLVDDGLATGASMQAAVGALRSQKPARVIVAVPVAAADVCERLRRHADEVLCAYMPEPFTAVGLWYEDFSQTSDDEVTLLLSLAHAESSPLPD